MMLHAYAPSANEPPDVYVRYTWVKELGMTWAEAGGLDPDEVPLLVDCINIQRQREELAARAKAARR